MTALELAAAIRQRKIGAVEATRFFLDRIDKNGARVNAFLALTREEALKRAAEAQARIDRGAPASPLDGVPIALKDNIATKGAPTTCASRMLEGVTPERSAEVVEKIEAAGLIVLGKLNMDEFSMGSSSDTGAFGPVRNPWDESRAAGGSSGGS
ncbi:MAG: amidase family protein, partial [Treponema sp.]|nr:amidase family protein [Treponema sp.]